MPGVVRPADRVLLARRRLNRLFEETLSEMLGLAISLDIDSQRNPARQSRRPITVKKGKHVSRKR